MSSAVKADNLEAALEAAIRRFDGTSPVTPQVHAYFGYTGDADAVHPRSRMRLVLEVVAEEGGSYDAGVDVACAVEMLHCSTLVHHTVEDPAKSRFGLAHGINAGDALCAMAYLQLLESPSGRPPEETVEMTRALQAANFSLCDGQAQELALACGERAGDDAYRAMLFGRAALFAVACELGAIAAGAACTRAAAYAALGRAYGMAFQISRHVHGDPAERPIALPPMATPAMVNALIADADAQAVAAGIDISGRVRAYLADAIRPAA